VCSTSVPFHELYKSSIPRTEIIFGYGKNPGVSRSENPHTKKKKTMWGFVVAVGSKISGDSHQKVPLQNIDSTRENQTNAQII